MNVKGIDVSHHNGTIDWDKVKAAGVQFALLRASWGIESKKQIDSQFERNYAECKRVGIPVGAYHFSYAKSPAEAKKELEFFLKNLKGKQFEYPVMFDLEDETLENLPKSVLTDNVIAFCDGLEKAGYYAALYSNPDWLTQRLDLEKIKRFDLWFADWRKNPSKAFPHGIWQYSETGRVNGIVGNVDLDIAYKDYPTIIKKAGLNGYSKKADTYRVTAEISGIPSAKAGVIKSACEQMGMSVIQKKE